MACLPLSFTTEYRYVRRISCPYYVQADQFRHQHATFAAVPVVLNSAAPAVRLGRAAGVASAGLATGTAVGACAAGTANATTDSTAITGTSWATTTAQAGRKKAPEFPETLS